MTSRSRLVAATAAALLSLTVMASTTPPTAPPAPTVTAEPDDAGVRVVPAPAPRQSGRTPSTYQVERAIGDGAFAPAGAVTATARARGYLDRVGPGVYAYRTRARYGTRRFGPYSAAAVISTVPPPRWETVGQEHFAGGLGAWVPWQSGPQQNTTDGRYPTLAANHTVEPVEGATDGYALAMWNRPGTYTVPGGTADGWTTARGRLTGAVVDGPFRVEARYRVSASVGNKYAVMWWPAGGGWAWEIDMAEDFGGRAPDGARDHIAVRWHFDLDGDGAAREQPIRPDVPLDATQWRTVVLEFDGDTMTETIDGSVVARTSDPQHLPTGAGFFSIGKALTGDRDRPDRTTDAIYLDYVTVSRLVSP